MMSWYVLSLAFESPSLQAALLEIESRFPYNDSLVQDKNLGEQVDAQARTEAEAAPTRLEAQ